MLKAGLTLLSGNAVAAMLLLIRNLAIAALIPLEDYGIAATFAIAMAVVEMASDLGLHQQIVQSEKGEAPRFQAALQGFQVLRGGLAGAVLYLCAGPFAALMGVSEVAWAYQWLALVPVLNALQHFDIHRLHRAMRFGPMVTAKILPALASLSLAWPLAVWLGDYRVMLWAIVVQAVAGAILSHVVAERPYRLVFDASVMGDSLRFGWPLLISGALLFAVFQGDKIIVGRLMGMEALALLAMGLTLTLTPTMVLSKSLQAFFLPQLSRSGADWDRLAQVAFETAIFVSAVFIAAVALIAPLVIAVIGPDYAPLLPLLIWLAIAQGVRIAKVGHSVVALSRGVTILAMWANLARVAVLPIAAWVAWQGGGLWAIVCIGLLGEVLGYLLGLVMLRQSVGVTVRIGPQVAFAVCLALTAFAGSGLALILCPIGVAVFLPHLRAYLRTGAQADMLDQARRDPA